MSKNTCICTHRKEMHVCFSVDPCVTHDGERCLGMTSSCDCIQYVPSNNLEYIELVYDKKSM